MLPSLMCQSVRKRNEDYYFSADTLASVYYGVVMFGVVIHVDRGSERS